MTSELKEKVAALPHTPGVYIYKNAAGKVIYVGKAKSLRDRVGSYFAINLPAGTKTHALVKQINDLDVIHVETEFEALILEAELIKKYRPKYNVLQKDDKSYLYIVIRKEKSPLVDKVITARRPDLLPTDVTFGPYPDGATAKSILRTIRRLYPFRDCSTNKFMLHKKSGKPCLFGFIGVCTAPCVYTDSTSLERHKENIKQIRNLLQGKGSSIVREIESKMKKASALQNYEEASKYRDLLTNFKYVAQTFKSPEQYINNPFLLSDLADEALNSLVELIPSVKKPPIRIECYDISNISGTDAVASMVVATNGRIDKSQYRRFQIKQKHSPDDFEMMREALTRRLKHANWSYPDILMVDGGKGQVSAAYTVAQSLGLEINIIGLAKKEETIVYYDGSAFQEFKYPKDAAGLKLLIRLRDESHRFAQSYHHKLRAKRIRS